MGVGRSICCEDEHPVQVKEVVQSNAFPDTLGSIGAPDDLLNDINELELDVGHTKTDRLRMQMLRVPAASKEPTGSGSRSRSNPRNVRNLTRFQIDEQLLRGIPLRRSLRSCGKLWTKSPCDLPDEDRKGLWDKSQKVARLNTFLSHTWNTPGWLKVISLLVQSGRFHFLLGWLVGVLIGAALDLLDVLPALQSFDCGTVSRCERSPWLRIFGFFGSVMGLWGSPYVPQLHSDMCFLDIVSINQADPDLMGRGIYGLGGFLAVSAELRILWSRPYLTRLWCIFELAAFRKANPEGKIVLKPIFLETFVICVVFCFYIWLAIDEARIQITLVSRQVSWEEVTSGVGPTNILAFISLLPVIWGLHQSRKVFREKHKVVEDLKHFDLTKVSCRTPEDREFIYHGIEMWYGSTHDFEEYVRGPLATELTQPFMRTNFPFSYWLMLITPFLSVGLDISLGRLQADKHLSLATFYFCMNASVTSAFSLLLCGKWALYLSERLAPAASSCLLDWGKTLLLWLLVVMAAGGARLALAQVAESPATLVILAVIIFICFLVFPEARPWNAWKNFFARDQHTPPSRAIRRNETIETTESNEPPA